MARRRRDKESFIDTLFGLPWQASVVLGVAVFIGLKWILPAVGAGNMFLKPIAAAASSVAWLFSGVFFLIGALVYTKSVAERKKAPVLGISPGVTRGEPSWAKHATRGGAAEPVGKVKRGPLGEPLETESQKQPVDIYDAWKEPSMGPSEKPTQWTIELIRDIEWKRFEDVCQRFYETKGIRSETTPLGPDGGIDIRLFQDDSGQATSIVQCKAWGERFVGVKPVRELLGVMTHERIGKAFFMTSGRFSDDAKEVAKSNRITLIDGEMFLMMIRRLSELDQRSLLDFAVAGDYKTPTCPGCGTKMKAVEGKAGRPAFWGCHNYPSCRQTLGMRRAA